MPPSHRVYLEPRLMVILMTEQVSWFLRFIFVPLLDLSGTTGKNGGLLLVTTKVQRKGVSGVHRHVCFYNTFLFVKLDLEYKIIIPISIWNYRIGVKQNLIIFYLNKT